MRPIAKISAAIALLVALLLAVAAMRELREGAQAMRESDLALAAGDLLRTIAAARAAAEAQVPGSPYPARAYDRLGTLARDAEARGDERAAILAWAAMRAAALETSGLGASTERWRAAADEGIARVGARSWSGPEARATSEVRPAQAALETALARTDLPEPTTFLLLAVGGAAFFGGVARLLWVAVSPDRTALRRSHLAALAAVVGGALYVLACVRG